MTSREIAMLKFAYSLGGQFARQNYLYAPLAGAGLGAGIGALIGGEDSRGQGAGIGAGVGALTGLAAGGAREAYVRLCVAVLKQAWKNAKAYPWKMHA
jgi:hypothetical protein